MATMQELRKTARERVKSKCRVCPVCDGRACAGEIPGMGGIGTGSAFRNNITALAAFKLNMRVMHEANTPDVSCTLWDRKLSLPVLAAPVGNVQQNLGSDMDNADYTRKLIEGCVKAGTLAGIGDVPELDLFAKYMKLAGEYSKNVIPFIKPWVTDAVAKRFDLAAEAGCDICGMDVDAAGLPHLRSLPTPAGVKTPKEMAEIIKAAHDRKIKFIVKGVMTADEAVIAADAGADAIIVSNHGGRVLDHAAGAAEVLEGIAEAVGHRLVVMADGGIRTGVDVLKILALGAKVSLICRPVAVILHGDENEAVPAYFTMIRSELSQAMQLTGCNDLASVTRRILL
ncbi:MAG: L-lactate dehydrogenase [Desulfovibrio sp.]